MKSLFEEVCEKLEGCSTVKQFAEPLLEIIEVTSTVSIEDQMRIEQNFSRSCELLQAEELESLSVMKNITAGGPVLQKTLKR